MCCRCVRRSQVTVPQALHNLAWTRVAMLIDSGATTVADGPPGRPSTAHRSDLPAAAKAPPQQASGRYYPCTRTGPGSGASGVLRRAATLPRTKAPLLATV